MEWREHMGQCAAGLVDARRGRSASAGAPTSGVFFFQAEDGIRDYKVTGSDVCSSDLVLQLLLVDLEVDGLGVLGVEFLPQVLLLVLVALQLGPLLVPDQEVATQQRQREKRRRDRAGAHRQGPAARIARIECAQLVDEIHCRPPAPPRLAFLIRLLAEPPSSGATVVTWSAVSVKLEPGVGPLAVCTTSSSGLRSHWEPSMLRMKEEDRKSV